MVLADKKRESNIAEYIIHMYQTEDLIRAFEFDIERINKDLISLLPGEEPDKLELKEWYSSLIASMEKEQITVSGHLSSIIELTKELEELYSTLVAEDVTFQQIVQNAQSVFNNVHNLSEVESCLNGMYAYLILKSNNTPVPTITEKRAEIYGEVLSYLSFKYKQKHYLSEN